MNQSPEPNNVIAFERAKRSGYRILIVEDEMIIALGLIDMVEALGASGVAASRVANALTLVDTEPFDAAIVDMNLSGEPAGAVIEALASRDIPFIITTGYGADAIAERYRGLPKLYKPYMQTQVEAALLSILAPCKRSACST